MSSKRSLHRRANEHTLVWLETNYEIHEGICLPRCLLYHHYLDYMRKRGNKPIGAAAFGKLVRQKFPKITTRRLGTRGQSKYHYYGVGIKLTSIYYEDQRIPTNNKIMNRASGVKKTKRRTKARSKVNRTPKVSSQLIPQLKGNVPLLRHFPRSHDFVIPIDVHREMLSTFLLMYRTHCQRIMDTFIRGSGTEIERYLNHFWSGIPEHLCDLLNNSFLANVIECADSILYKAIEKALAPKSLQELPDQFSQELLHIIKSLPQWIQSSMNTLPQELTNKKLEVLQQFSSAFKRQLSFMQLVKSCKLVLSQPENVRLMCREIECVDTYEIWSQIATICPENQMDTIYNSFCSLMSFMRKGLSIEQLTDWVNIIVDKCVVKGKCACLTSRASQLVFALGTYLSGIIRDLTLNNAKSFGFWHLVFVTLEEYVLLMVSRAVRYESQSVRCLAIMKQPLNTVISFSSQPNAQQTNFNTIPNNFAIKANNSNANIEKYNDINLIMSMTCLPWQEIDDSSTSYFYNEHNGDHWPITDTNNEIITSNGNVYTCLA